MCKLVSWSFLCLVKFNFATLTANSTSLHSKPINNFASCKKYSACFHKRLGYAFFSWVWARIWTLDLLETKNHSVMWKRRDSSHQKQRTEAIQSSCLSVRVGESPVDNYGKRGNAHTSYYIWPLVFDQFPLVSVHFWCAFAQTHSTPAQKLLVTHGCTPTAVCVFDCVTESLWQFDWRSEGTSVWILTRMQNDL